MSPEMSDEDRKAKMQRLPQWMQDELRRMAQEREELEAECARIHEQNQKNMQLLASLKKKQRPLPPYARHMSTAQLNRTFCWYFLMRWEFYLVLVAFVLFAAYFPWPWVADWGAVKAFVAVMERIVPSIDGLPPEARHLPLAASKAQLSFIHFCGGIGFVYKLITQRPAVWREGSKRRFMVIVICAAILGALYVSAIFFWSGNFNIPPDQAWHANRLQIAGYYTSWWLALTMTFSMCWSGIQELIRQLGLR